jgi:hypothetical protein
MSAMLADQIRHAAAGAIATVHALIKHDRRWRRCTSISGRPCGTTN